MLQFPIPNPLIISRVFLTDTNFVQCEKVEKISFYFGSRASYIVYQGFGQALLGYDNFMLTHIFGNDQATPNIDDHIKTSQK